MWKIAALCTPTLRKGSVHVTSGKDLILESSHVKCSLWKFYF